MQATTQEDKFQVLLLWLSMFGINPNIEKLKRQVVCITRWMERGCNGAIQAVTGFGKTYVALFAIYLIKKKFPDFKVIIVVPSTKLYDDWKEHLTNFNLKDCTVHIINSYTKEKFWDDKWNCDLLIVDEGHRCLGKDSVYFSKVLTITKRKATLVLSATLDEKEKEKLKEFKIPIVDTVSMIEAKRMNFVSDYTVYNLGVSLEEDEQEAYDRLHKWHNDMFARFQQFPYFDMNYQLASACMQAANKNIKIGIEWRTAQEWREWVAEKMEWNSTLGKEHEWSPQSVAKYATQWNLAMIRRKSLLYKHPIKVACAVDVINYLGNIPIITFAENIDITNQLVEKLGNRAKPYHSELEGYEKEIELYKTYKDLRAAKIFAKARNTKPIPNENGGYEVVYKGKAKVGVKALKREILDDFEKGKFNVLCTAKALDEGFNVEGIEVAIILSATSKQRQYIQRTGRAIRFVPNKSAKIINIYIKNTKDQDWLETRQKGETGIKWIDSIEQIL